MEDTMFKKIILLLAALLVSLPAYSVNINTASAKDLAAALNGVGASKAESIVAYREKSGAFKVLKDLVKVKGIGAATVAKNRSNIELGLK